MTNVSRFLEMAVNKDSCKSQFQIHLKCYLFILLYKKVLPNAPKDIDCLCFKIEIHLRFVKDLG